MTENIPSREDAGQALERAAKDWAYYLDQFDRIWLDTPYGRIYMAIHREVPDPETYEPRHVKQMIEEPELRLYCVMRTDLDTVAGGPVQLGKIMAQAGHAFIGCFSLCHDALRYAYLNGGAQPKITLAAKNEHELQRAKKECDDLGIKTYLVTDAGRTVFNEPTVTCLGIGPVAKERLPKYVQRLRLL